MNKNKETIEEFQDLVTKVYFLIASKEEQLTENKVQDVETFSDILEQYTKKTNNLKPVSLEEKMRIIIDKINQTRMIGIDVYSYLLQLRKIIFTEEEQENNFKITVMRNTEMEQNGMTTTAKAVLALRTPQEDGKHLIRYFIFTPGEKLIPISKEELKAKLESNEMGYVAKDDPVIPGLGGRK